MNITHPGLTLDICTEAGSRTRFHQNDEQLIAKTLRQLVTARLFNQAMLTLGSAHSVSAIPANSIDMIRAHTASPPPLPLPGGWLAAVEVNDNSLLNVAALREAAEAEGRNVVLAEIHTFGDWMIRLKLETIAPATIQEERQLWNHLLQLPAIPFHLQDGGIGAINPAKIVRVTVTPPIEAIGETALPVDLMQCLRP